MPKPLRTIYESRCVKQHQLLSLIEKYLAGNASGEERDRLEQHFNSFQQNRPWPEDELGLAADTEKAILQKLRQSLRPRKGRLVIAFFRQPALRVAAAFLLLLSGLVIWWTLSRRDNTLASQTDAASLSSGPYKTNTTLTLADGRVMILDSLADGILVKSGKTVIRKQGSKIVVHALGPAKDTGVYTLQTPGGRQCEALLGDGSQVWLNAASSLRFPAAFDSSERRVQLSGEAYFDVAADKHRPFRVVASASPGENSPLIEAVGTQFNINAYDDEKTLKATLVEGAVKVAPVAAAENASVLTAGQQAEVSKEATGLPPRVKSVDVAEFVAWKDNLFNFNNSDLPGIMRQLARWYNVEVVYAGAVPVRHFSGKINRSLPLSTVLEILEQSNIRFKVKGRQIVVKS